MNCATCYTIYAKNKKKPACLVGRCHIVDIAPDIELNRLVNAFLECEMLEMSPGYAPYQRKILKESGLLNESPATILALKSVLADYRDWKNKMGK